MQHETIFAARLACAVEPRGNADDLASDGITSACWWSLPELARCRAEVWPADLANLATELVRGELDPALPRELSHG